MAAELRGGFQDPVDYDRDPVVMPSTGVVLKSSPYVLVRKVDTFFMV